MVIDEGDIKLSFIAEWFDPHPQVVDRFLLKYYPKSQEVEMKDLKATRKFLKRTKIKLPRDDFILDAVVVIFSRDLKLVSYGDDETRLLLEASSEKALTILNNCSIGKVLSMSEEAGLTLVDMKTFDTRTMKNTSISFGKVYLEVRGEGAVSLLEGIIESTEKKDTTMVLASTSKEAITIKEEFLLKKHQPPAVKYETGDQGTCCAIKPHAIKSRLVGKIIEDIISRDLNIKSMQVVHMDRTRASEFNEVYCKLKEFHSKNIDEFCSGPILALEIATSVEEFRAHCGPVDVEMAKSLRPDTIRAKFGKNRIQNAVHCTDFKEDSVDELCYMFDILAKGE